jgi:hypothetical protein
LKVNFHGLCLFQITESGHKSEFQQESNLGPTDLEASALATELCFLANIFGELSYGAGLDGFYGPKGKSAESARIQTQDL